MSEQSFDERAATWDDDPAKVERARIVADTVREAIPLQADTRLLDYGAGTGLLAQHLAPHVGGIAMADPSVGMRAVMEQKVADGLLPGGRVLDLDLGPDERFDVVVSLMALHHVPDPPALLRDLAAVVEPDGWLGIIDLEAEDGSFHGEGADVHDGFQRDVLTDWLRAAGFGTAAFRPCHEVIKHDRAYPLFLAVARRQGRS